MKKSIYFLALLIAPLIVTACSRSSEKEIVTVPTVVETPKIELPQGQIVVALVKYSADKTIEVQKIDEEEAVVVEVEVWAEAVELSLIHI